METRIIKIHLIILIYFTCSICISAYAATTETNELTSSLDSLLEELSGTKPTNISTPPIEEESIKEEIIIEEPSVTIEKEEQNAETLPLLEEEFINLDTVEIEQGEIKEIFEQDLSAPVGPFVKPDPKDAKDPPPSTPKTETETYTHKVQLEGLNKITARTSTLITDINTPITFGTLEIQIARCWKSAPEDLPENKALIKIWEKIPGELTKLIFHGWMFSSSPSLSPLEHPVYDITVAECIKDK